MKQKIKKLSLAVGVLAMLTMLAFDAKYVKEANNVLRGVVAQTGMPWNSGTTAGGTGDGTADSYTGYIITCTARARFMIDGGNPTAVGYIMGLFFTAEDWAKEPAWKKNAVSVGEVNDHAFDCILGGNSKCFVNLDKWFDGPCRNGIIVAT